MIVIHRLPPKQIAAIYNIVIYCITRMRNTEYVIDNSKQLLIQQYQRQNQRTFVAAKLNKNNK